MINSENEIQLMVSIHCLAYNQEPYIGQCLEGFVSQKTCFRFEAIVHDDASTDGTAAIISSYAEKYPDIIKPIYEEENQYSKGNLVLFEIMESHLHGKYVCICEGDDYWVDPYKLQKEVDFLETHEECVLVHTGAIFVNKNSSIIGRNKFTEKKIDYRKYIIEKGNPIITASVCYRHDADKEWRTIVSEIPFQLMMGDKPHWIFLATKGSFKYLPDITTAYRILDNSASHHSSPERALQYSKNGSDINYYFNKIFNIGIPERKIKIYELSHRMLVLIHCEKKIFWSETLYSLREMPLLFFTVNFWKVLVKRLIDRY